MNSRIKMEVEPIAKPTSLGETAYRSLKDSIVRGAFPMGEKLTIRAIASALDVSTTPARDAVNRLLAEGALVNEGPKTVVIPPLTAEAMEELLQTRLALEGLAAERSADAITDADVAELHRLQEQINKGLDRGRYRDVLLANRKFHFLIYNRSGWPRLVLMIESLWLRVGPSLLSLYPEFAVNRKGVSNHGLILDAVERRDGAAIRRAIEQDLRDGCQQMLDSIRLRDAAKEEPRA